MKTKDSEVLVVDDESAVCRNCERILREEGFNVTTTTSGEECLVMVGAKVYDAVILDIKMPKVNGIELLKKIKEQNPETMVILITGYPSLNTAIEAVKYGANDYILKPFTPDELSDSVKEALKKRKLIAGEGGYLPLAVAEAGEKKEREYPKWQEHIESIKVINKSGEHIAVIGLGNVFGGNGNLTKALIARIKKMNLPVNLKLASREIVGKEFVPYLELNDKIIIVAGTTMGGQPGDVRQLNSMPMKSENLHADSIEGYAFIQTLNHAKQVTPDVKISQIAYPEVIKWINALGLDPEVFIIGVETNAAAESEKFAFTPEKTEKIIEKIVSYV